MDSVECLAHLIPSNARKRTRDTVQLGRLPAFLLGRTSAILSLPSRKYPSKLLEMSGEPCRHALAAAQVSAKRWETRIDLHACLEHARNYLRDHGQEPRSVQNAARFVGISRSHFIRVFTETYGRSPREYIVRSRMERAALHLALGFSVAEAALQVGYEDVNAFGRAFKRWSSETPSAYAKRARSAGS